MNTKLCARLFLSACLVIVVGPACNDASKEKHKASQKGAISSDEGTVQPAIEDNIEAQGASEDEEISEELQTVGVWSILNEKSDWNLQDTLPAAALAKRFPLSNEESDVAFIEHGHDFFRARIKSLRSAKKSIRMQTFIFRADESGQAIANELVAAKKRGVKVELIIDPVINYKPEDRRQLLQMLQKGIVVRGYEPGYRDFLKSLDPDSDLVAQVFDKNYRFHEKMIIIDGEDVDVATAIIGGVNAANEYFGLASENSAFPWVDRDIALRGPVVLSMAESFDRNMVEMSALFGNESALSSSPLGELTAFGSLIYNLIQGEFSGAPAIIEEVRSLAASASSYKFKWEAAKQVRFIQSRPRLKEDLIFPAYIKAIEEAASEILINNSYFLPEEELILALRRAVVRGVRIKVLTNTKELTDVPKQVEIARTRYKYLLDANNIAGAKGKIEISEWSGDAILNNKLGLNHAKYAVFDRDLSIVGSYNLDPRSHSYNAESVIAFAGATKTADFLAKEFKEHFDRKNAVVITAEAASGFQGQDGLSSFFKNTLNNLIAPFL